MNVMKTQVLGDRYAHGFYPKKGDNVEPSKWMWKMNESAISPWFEYYWRDQYLHHMWSYGEWTRRARGAASSGRL